MAMWVECVDGDPKPRAGDAMVCEGDPTAGDRDGDCVSI